MAQKVLYQIEVDAKFDDLNKLEIRLDNLKNSRKSLLKIQKEQGNLNKQQRQNLTKLNQEIAKTSTAMKGVKTDIKNTEKATKGLGNSYNALTAKNAILAKRLREVQDPLGKGKKRFDALALSIKNNTDKLTKMDASMGRHQRNVGNYGQAFSALTPMMGSFGSQITMLQGTFAGLKTALVGTDKAQKATAISSRTLAISMMAIPIVAIVGAFVALVGAFASTQRGMNAINKVIGPLKTVFDAFLGIVQELSYKALDSFKDALSDPLGALKDLGKAIVENVLNRFKAFGVFIEAINLALDGDWTGAMSKGADAVILLGTGVENGTAKLDEFGKKAKEVAKNAIDTGLAIEDLKVKFRELELASVVPIAKLKLEYQKLKEAANDQLKTDEERVKSMSDAMDVQREIAKIEGELLQLQIDRMTLEQSTSNTTDEEKLELQKLIVQQIQYQEQAQKKISGLMSLQSGLIKKIKKQYEDFRAEVEEEIEPEPITLEIKVDAYADTEKDFKFIADAQKQITESNNKANDERQKDNEKTNELIKNKSLELAQQTSDSVFAIKQANLQRQTKIELDQLQSKNDLENDLLKSKLESGLITQEEYENNRIALEQRTEEEKYKLQKAAFEKKKKLDTAQAIVNGALAITSILATSPDILKPIGPLFLAQVGAAVASTAIQVGTIQSQQFAKGGLLEGASHEQGGIPMLVDGKRPIEAEGGEAIINKRSVAMFGKELDYINRAGGGVPLFESGGYIRKFANGGLIQNNGISTQDLEKQNAIFANTIRNLRVVNVASDTIGTYDNAIKIENEFTF